MARAWSASRGQHPHAHGLALVDQRRVAPHRRGPPAVASTTRGRAPTSHDAQARCARRRARRRPPPARTRAPRLRPQRARGRGRLATSAPAAVLDAEAHAQVGGHPVEVEVARARPARPTASASRRASTSSSGPSPGPMPASASPGPVGGGHQVAAHRLGQRADQRRHQVVPVAGHLPVEPVGADLVEHGQGHVHGHAVVVGARGRTCRSRRRSRSPWRQVAGKASASTGAGLGVDAGRRG